MKILTKVLVAAVLVGLGLPLVERVRELLQSPGAPGWQRMLVPVPIFVLLALAILAVEVVDRRMGKGG